MVCTSLCLHYVRVRVSYGHLCKTKAPTEVAAEMVAYTKNSLPCVRGGRGLHKPYLAKQKRPAAKQMLCKQVVFRDK